MDPAYIEVGSLIDDTDPTYGDIQPTHVPVYECGRCSALVSQFGRDNHTNWHRGETS